MFPKFDAGIMGTSNFDRGGGEHKDPKKRNRLTTKTKNYRTITGKEEGLWFIKLRVHL